MKTNGKKQVSREKQRTRKEIRSLLRRFAQYISERRNHSSLTLRELGGRAQIPYANIFQLEQAKKDPRLSDMLKLAKAFHEPLGQFLAPVLEVDPPAPETESAQRKEEFTEMAVKDRLEQIGQTVPVTEEP